MASVWQLITLVLVALTVQLTCANLELNARSLADNEDNYRRIIDRRARNLNIVPHTRSVRYPHLLDAHKYYIRVTYPDGKIVFAEYTCPNGIHFNPGTETCEAQDGQIADPPIIPELPDIKCGSFLGYYCHPSGEYTYCTPDKKEIIPKASCVTDKRCYPGESFPCTKKKP
ncbi:hypothetical protein L798_01193 [Zootermopsis nevadensis]|uniref:Chitin-binding type-2 domain-containing protein n=1 Tax=Zootermopsis nevadensis TaxID=136037 RepID=A0A067RNY0_ZOONE|nr:hypothetical protein L798_01193 [Zootermopsis nevadensis]